MSKPWFGAASVTGGKIKTLARKRPIALDCHGLNQAYAFVQIIARGFQFLLCGFTEDMRSAR
jgi:hypothetical protein